MSYYVLVYSGGLDSSVLLYDLLAAGHKVRCIGFNYGQRHIRELTAGQAICNRLGVEYLKADLSSLKKVFAGSALTDPEIQVPHGHYTDPTMRATVVPNRNMIMLSLALGWAISTESIGVAYAAHSGDHAIYPDCRPQFVEAMQMAAGCCDYNQLQILTPFLLFTKAEIVRRGAELKVPFGDTWSCYEGGEVHCGECGTCFERREAFNHAHVPDPTTYRAGAK